MQRVRYYTCMVIQAKFSSECPNCRLPIQPGERVEWNRGERARHTTCPWTSDRCEHPQFHRNGCTCAVKINGTDSDDRSYDAWIALQTQDARDEARGREILNAGPETAQPAHIAVEEQGVYVMADGAIVKVQANREKTRTYAKRLVEIGGVRLTEAGERVNAEYQYEAGLVDQVAREGRKMTLDEAKAFILRYGFCARCSRQLKDATSVLRGIGPVCVTYFGDAPAQPSGDGLEPGSGPAFDSPRRDYPDTVSALPSFRCEHNRSNHCAVDGTPLPTNLRARQAENWLTAKRSRWCRPDDDELESAAY